MELYSLCATVSQPNRTLDETSQLYKELSSKMFSASSPLSVLSGTSRLVWSHAYYDTSMWEEFLKEYLGDISMIKTSRIPGCPKVKNWIKIFVSKILLLKSRLIILVISHIMHSKCF